LLRADVTTMITFDPRVISLNDNTNVRLLHGVLSLGFSRTTLQLVAPGSECSG
jgi:hypothetical protein